jgi:tetratricopeptide (TPR) repeat protein
MDYLEKNRYNSAVKTLNAALKWPENIGVGKPYDPEQRKIELLLAYSYDKLGKESDAKQYLENAIKYTMDRIDQPRPDNYLGLLALDLNGQQEKAQQILSQINNSPRLPGTYKDWITDQYEHRGVEGKTDRNMDSDYELLSEIGNLIQSGI